MNYVEIIAAETKIRPEFVRNTLTLFDQGSTVPFITRYRKEVTGSMDENQIRQVEELYAYHKELDERRTAILKSIEAQGKLTPELKSKIEKSMVKTELEDLYLPFKPKRRTRAMAAKELGLEPLARLFEAQEHTTQTAEQLAAPFVRPELHIADAAAAISGALDILAEEFSENAEMRSWLRDNAMKKGLLTCKVTKAFEGKRSKFEMYYEFKEKVSELPSHRILAIRRGEKEEVLKSDLMLEDEKNLSYFESKIIKSGSPFAAEFKKMLKDGYERLLKPSIETEVRLALKEKGEAEAYVVFGKNMRDVLLAAPAGPKVIMGVDPGFRSGVKLAIIDGTGKFLEARTIYPMPPQQQLEASQTILLAMVESFKVDIIAIGNGTASRETEEFIGNAIATLENPPIKVVVSEAGASVYSVAPVAQKEFPTLDPTIRSAISIGRRIQDALAELVKIDPKSIGVGQYQHDVNQNELKRKLEHVVESCVNSVGVDVNSASESLLAYIAGVNKSLAKNIVEYRNANGPFASRSSLVKVPLFGPKAFEQAAGFLRVQGSENVLDASAVHPERYELVKKICEDLSVSIKEIIGNKELIGKIEINKFVSDEVGLPTLNDILSELEKPSRDPRAQFTYAKFDAKVQDLKDLVPGTWMEGMVTNVTNFGAFIDIGVHQDGLVHISEIADKFVDDAKKIVSTGDIVQVRVLEVDAQQKRISLSMKKESATDAAQKPGAKKVDPKKKNGPKKLATVDQLLNKFGGGVEKKSNNVKLQFSVKSLMRSGR